MGIKINGLSLDCLSHPSETVLELMTRFKVSKKDVLNALEISKVELNLFLSGKKNLNNETLSKLEKVFETSELFWINLNENYLRNLQYVLNEASCTLNEALITENVFQLSNFKILKDNGNKNIIDKIKYLRKQLKVKNLELVECEYVYGFKFRKSIRSNTSKIALAIYIREILNEHNYRIDHTLFNNKKLFELLPEIRKLTTLDDIFEVEIKLKELLKAVGINFLLFPYSKKMAVYGFMLKDDDSINIGISTKGKFFDIFWFTFFHEISHILINSNKTYFIDSDEEFAADEMSQNLLIDRGKYMRFLKGEINNNSIVDFATELDIAPGLIVGRLQHDRIINYSDYNYLKSRIK